MAADQDAVDEANAAAAAGGDGAGGAGGSDDYGEGLGGYGQQYIF